MSFRVPPELKEMMDQAAAKSGRSVAQEIEMRLERTFQNENLRDQVLELAFGRIDGDLTYVLGKILQIATSQANALAHAQCWCDEPSAFKATETFIKSLLDNLRPRAAANDERAKDIEYYMGRAILLEFSGENWINERFERLGSRANAVNDWRQQLKQKIEAQPLRQLVSETRVLLETTRSQPTKSSEEQK
jgi:hypothetical protein